MYVAIIFRKLFTVHGDWTEWTEWTCAGTCGQSSAIRTRNCSNPEPKDGGNECLKLDNTTGLFEQEVRPCNLSCCPGNIFYF